MKEKIISKIGINNFCLKMLAIIIMLIDHIGYILFPTADYMWLRYIGRLAFPIFCFLLVEGFFHTRDVAKYAARLGLFALVSEIPYNLASSGSWIDLQYQNVFMTLFIGLVLLVWMEKYQRLLGRFVGIIIAMVGAHLLRTDYGAVGILTILSFYALRDKFILQSSAMVIINMLLKQGVQGFAVLAMIPIGLYNGKKGPSMKYFFYIFYPMHLLILVGIRYFIR